MVREQKLLYQKNRLKKEHKIVDVPAEKPEGEVEVKDEPKKEEAPKELIQEQPKQETPEEQVKRKRIR